MATTPLPKPPPGHEQITLTPAQAATVAEAVAIAITQRDKFLRINGLVRGDLARDDPGIADLTALIDAHPALGARVRHRF